ncbi:caprin homolog [Nasonia vitripennis]|uniref:Caprin-1 dimerization domain-containing protein n=1 Tax=Nasonia vitripennis TaxID=7425 RepID=A0A7M7Q8K7_NASVI|nr:caprin homolog [Nasonia vitripennis]
MPSANPKLEKQASTEAVDPIKQAIIVIEHKIRNLEKRKGKLESYRDIVKNGGELNADQKTAVAKYDEVQQTLDITRELYKQIVGIANDAAKQQKKLARKEALERMQQDISKVREVLLIQDTLMNMGAQGVRDDFINGVNGAIKLAEEDMKYLDDLYNEVMLKHERQESEPSFLQQAQKVAEHYVLIVDGKQREVVGTTYSKLKDIITSITQCGYFDQVQDVEVAVEEVTQAVAETQIGNAHVPEQVNEEYNNQTHIPLQQPETLMPMQTFPVPVAAIPVVSGAAPVPTPMPVIAQPIPAIPQPPVDPSYYTNAATFVPAQQVQQQPLQQPPQAPAAAPAPRINDVIGPATNFFFLQDSELDAPEVNAPVASQAPPTVVSHIPTAATVVATAVTLNAPIPTQTFTNQSFAGPPVVPPQVMYQHQPPQEMSHMPAFGNANPQIPMPTSHQTGIPFNQQSPGNFQQQQTQTFEQIPQQENLTSQKEDTHDNADKSGNETGVGEGDVGQNNGSLDWVQTTDNVSGDWNSETQQSNQDSQQGQNSQQVWADGQRGGFRGRGGRRGNVNGYNNRARGNYQQNGRGGGSYYRNNDGGNYQNGYQRNWSNNSEGNSGYSGGFKRSASNQSRGGGPRGERSGMDRGGRSGGGGNFRGTQRGANRTNYAPRGKAQTQN